jgi:hypothetical protein
VDACGNQRHRTQLAASPSRVAADSRARIGHREAHGTVATVAEPRAGRTPLSTAGPAGLDPTRPGQAPADHLANALGSPAASHRVDHDQTAAAASGKPANEHQAANDAQQSAGPGAIGQLNDSPDGLPGSPGRDRAT